VNHNKNSIAIERLTALWALNECGLGGFMHAFNSPFTGIFVGGISILLISLIALYSKNVLPALLKALSIVLLIKLSVSPHSPITAYLAVSFQAMLGAFLFSLFSVRSFVIILLAAITFLESALQKLLTLTILYGQSLWDAVDVYGVWISDKLSFLKLTLSSKTFIFLFVIVYFLSGIIIGFLIVRIIALIKNIDTTTIHLVPTRYKMTHNQNKTPFLPKKALLFWSVTLFLIAIPLFFFDTKYGGFKKGIYLLARSFLFLVLWYVIVGPLLLKGLNRLLDKSKSRYKNDVQNTLDLFPYLRDIIRSAWQDSKLIKGNKRVSHFLARSIAYSIHFKIPKE
jgi:hypothetical protein